MLSTLYEQKRLSLVSDAFDFNTSLSAVAPVASISHPVEFKTYEFVKKLHQVKTLHMQTLEGELCECCVGF